MATTVRQILDAAYAKSQKNRPGTIASESTELLQVVQRSLRGLFADAVNFNRKVYASRVQVVFDAALGGWRRPSNAEAVVRIETPAGAWVREVPFDDKGAEALLPSVYSMGQVFYPAGNPNDPVAGNLVFFCSMRPRDLAGLEGDPAGTLDPLWPEQFNEILILDVAIYLAVKDSNSGREGEIAALRGEREKWQARYEDFLAHETTTLTMRYGHDGRTNTSRVVPNQA